MPAPPGIIIVAHWHGLHLGTRNVLIEHGSARFPVEAARDAHEHGEGSLVTTCCIGIERRLRLLEECVGARHRAQHWLEQAEGVDDLRMVEGQLERDGPPGGVASDVSSPDAEMLEQRVRVGDVIGDRHRR